MHINIQENQINELLEIGNNIIENLKESEGIYIIDKDMNMRVLFYYKPEILFISESFSINHIVGKQIDIRDSNQLISICEYVSQSFDNSDKLQDSKLIKNIDKFIKEYMIDTLCVTVDRMRYNIIEAISLEYYNNLFLLNKNSLYGVNNIDGVLYKYDTQLILNNFKPITEDYFKDIFNHIYKSQSLFPFTMNDSKRNFINSELKTEDIEDPKFIFVSTASNTVISYEKIILDSYLSDYNIFDIMIDIVYIDKTSNTLVYDIQYIIDNKNTLLN